MALWQGWYTTWRVPGALLPVRDQWQRCGEGRTYRECVASLEHQAPAGALLVVMLAGAHPCDSVDVGACSVEGANDAGAPGPPRKRQKKRRIGSRMQRLLAVLGRAPEGALTTPTVCERLGLDPRIASRGLHLLEEMGMVRKLSQKHSNDPVTWQVVSTVDVREEQEVGP
jgi:hypothetical protein